MSLNYDSCSVSCNDSSSLCSRHTTTTCGSAADGHNSQGGTDISTYGVESIATADDNSQGGSDDATYGLESIATAGVTTTAATSFNVDSSSQTSAALADAQISQLKGKIVMIQKRNKNLLLQIGRMSGSESNVGSGVEGREDSNDTDTGSHNAGFILQVREAMVCQ